MIALETTQLHRGWDGRPALAMSRPGVPTDRLSRPPRRLVGPQDVRSHGATQGNLTTVEHADGRVVSTVLAAVLVAHQFTGTKGTRSARAGTDRLRCASADAHGNAAHGAQALSGCGRDGS